MVVTHIQRIEHGVQTNVPLVVDSEVCLYLVEHIVANHVPQNDFCPIFFLGLCVFYSCYGVALTLLCKHAFVQRNVVFCQRVWAYKAHLLEIVFIANVILYHSRKVVISEEIGCHFVAYKAEARTQGAFLRCQGVIPRFAHLHVELKRYHVKFAADVTFHDPP